MKEKSKDLIVLENETIVKKILRFLRNLFRKKEKQEEIYEEMEVQTSNLKTDFRDTIKEKVIDEKELKELQKMFHQGKIKEEELTEEQKDRLINLYDTQIKELKRKIRNRYKLNYNNN